MRERMVEADKAVLRARENAAAARAMFEDYEGKKQRNEFGLEESMQKVEAELDKFENAGKKRKADEITG